MNMCLYEPINGDYPTESFCNLHGTNCEGCSYNYDEKPNKEENQKEEFFGWPKGTKVSDIEKWFDKKARGEDTRK